MESTAAGIRSKITAFDGRFWRISDFKGSPGAVEKAFSRLASSGDVRRVRPGLYWRGRKTPLGMAPPAPEDVVTEVVTSFGNTPAGVGPAGLSASAALGMTTHIPKTSEIAVLGRPPHPPSGINFVGRSAPARREERLNPLEVAVLEVLRDWPRLVDVPHVEAVNRISVLISKGEIRPNRLARGAQTEPARVRERLRRLLTEVGHAKEGNRVPPARRLEVDGSYRLIG